MQIFEKVGKCPINRGWMLIFLIDNGKNIFQDLT